MKNIKLSLILVTAAFSISCANKNCREIRNENEKANPAAVTNPQGAVAMPQLPGGSDNSKVKVFKYDGSKQCGMAEATPLAKMQKDLKEIKVYSAENLPDGLMHIQACGTPTGKANVYEIDRKDLALAKKYGFQEWIY